LLTWLLFCRALPSQKLRRNAEKVSLVVKLNFLISPKSRLWFCDRPQTIRNWPFRVWKEGNFYINKLSNSKLGFEKQCGRSAGFSNPSRLSGLWLLLFDLPILVCLIEWPFLTDKSKLSITADGDKYRGWSESEPKCLPLQMPLKT
jgi:hypothetical protein